MTDSEVIEVLEKEESYMLSHGGDRQAKALRIAIDKIKILERLRTEINEKIDFEEKWLNDVLREDKYITSRNVEIDMNGIRHVVKGKLEE